MISVFGREDRSESTECTDWCTAVLMQCGKVQQAIDTCVHLNQWNMAIDLARNHNVRDTEPLLVKYAETLLEQNKTFSAVELYRKANHLVDAAKLLFEVEMLLYYQSYIVNLLSTILKSMCNWQWSCWGLKN